MNEDLTPDIPILFSKKFGVDIGRAYNFARDHKVIICVY